MLNEFEREDIVIKSLKDLHMAFGKFYENYSIKNPLLKKLIRYLTKFL